jgi:hypothetical protein
VSELQFEELLLLLLLGAVARLRGTINFSFVRLALLGCQVLQVFLLATLAWLTRCRQLNNLNRSAEKLFQMEQLMRISLKYDENLNSSHPCR